jgi:hypothetical protein
VAQVSSVIEVRGEENGNRRSSAEVLAPQPSASA